MKLKTFLWSILTILILGLVACGRQETEPPTAPTPIVAPTETVPQPTDLPTVGRCTDEYPTPSAYWTFDAVRNGQVADSGGRHAGTVVGQPSLVSGVVNKAIGLDGRQGRVEVTGFRERLDQLTLSAWVKLNGDRTPQTDALIARIEGTGREGSAYALGLRQGKAVAFAAPADLREGLTVEDADSVNELAGQWVHLVLAYDGSALRLYRGGEIVAQARQRNRTAPRSRAFNIWIGGAPTAEDAYLNGDLDEIALWNQTLDEEQIALLYRHGLSKLALYDVSGCAPVVGPTEPAYLVDFYELTPVGVPDAVAVFEQTTDLSVPLAEPVENHYKRYQILLDDFAQHSFFAGEVRFAPAGGLVVDTPLVYHGAAPNGRDADGRIVHGSAADWDVALGEYFVEAGTPFLSATRGGRVIGSRQCGCSTTPFCTDVPDFDDIDLSEPTCGPEADLAECPDWLRVSSDNIWTTSGGDQACGEICPNVDCPAPGEPGGTGNPPIVGDDFGFPRYCEPEPVGQLSEVCLALRGVAAFCPSYCRGLEDCGADLDGVLFGDLAGNDPQCSVVQCQEAGASGSALSQCCQQTFAEVNAQIEKLDHPHPEGVFGSFSPSEQYQICVRDPELGVCAAAQQLSCDGPLPPGLSCPWSNLDSAPDFDLEMAIYCQEVGVDEPECAVCGGGVGFSCVPLGKSTLMEGTDEGETDGADTEEEEQPEKETTKSKPDDENKKEQGTNGGTSADPVTLGSGELVFEATDVAFPARGVPFAFQRSYRSNGMRSGALGPGFTHTFEDYLELVGDRYNRKDVPGYCVNHPGYTRCLWCYSADGGRQLYVYDPASGVYSPGPGSFSTIRATPMGFVLREPGGWTRTYNYLGRLESIRDDQGFGLQLKWRRRSPDEVNREANTTRYAAALFDQNIQRYGIAYHAVGQGADPCEEGSLRACFFAELELAEVVDSYGRVFELVHTTYDASGDLGPNPDPWQPGDSPRRRRLKAVRYRGQNLVEYTYSWFDVTEEAYLTEVVRHGFAADGLVDTAPLRTRYEYQHDVITDHLTFDVDATGTFTMPTTFGKAVASALGRLEDEIEKCGASVAATYSDGSEALWNPADGCGFEVPVDVMGRLPPFDLGAQVKLQIADNIVRVYSGDAPDDLPDVETFYDPDPRSIDFDRAIKQRYGVMPASDDQPEKEWAPGTDDEPIFVWKSNLPQANLHQALTGQPEVAPDESSPDQNGAWYHEEVTLPAAVAGAIPIEQTVSFTEEVSNTLNPGAACELDSLNELPTFALRDPAETRADQQDEDGQLREDVTLVRSEFSCAAIAARHDRDPFTNENVRTHVADEMPEAGQRRLALEWDLARVCRWAKIEDREGRPEYHGLNFYGQTLVHAAPAPDDPDEWAITRRRYNADGLLVEETRPDGGRTEITYDAQHTGPEDEGPLADAPGGAVLYRANPLRIVEHAATSEHLVPPVLTDLDGSESPFTTLEWSFQYEPLYQQPVRVVQPDGTIIAYTYDYQQLKPPSLTQLTTDSGQYPAYTVLHQAVRNGVPPELLDSTFFLNKDIDGDGVHGVGKTSAGVVAVVQRDVDLGGGRVRDVGTRYQRNSTGRLVATTQIADLDTPAFDSDRVEYQYYHDLQAAEAGSFDPLDANKQSGPLALTRVLRTPDATAPDDIDATFVSYDALGGVRLTRRNDDPETEVVTTRDALGQVVAETTATGLASEYMYNDHGELVRERAYDPQGQADPLVTVTAWGLQDTSLGTCTEIEADACQDFQQFAQNVYQADAAGDRLPELEGAEYVVYLYDAEDRLRAVVDATDGRQEFSRSEAGAVVEEITYGTPNLVTRYAYDVAGRLLSVWPGGPHSPLTTHYQYDRFGRQVAMQTRAPSVDEFTPDEGTITELRYDLLGQPVAAWTVGDDGSGNRRVLQLSRTQLNAAGAPLFEHAYAAPSLPSSPQGFSGDGIVAGDAWASAETHYDHALRPVYYRPEGRGTGFGTKLTYDGFGLLMTDGPDARTEVDNVPRRREVVEVVLNKAEGPGAQNKPAMYGTLYDGSGRVVVQYRVDSSLGTDAPKLITEYHYDAIGRLYRAVDESGRAGERSFDRAGRVVTVDEFGPDGAVARTTTYGYDAMGRPVLETAASGQQTEYVYDAAGRIVAVTVGLNLRPEDRFETRVERDGVGRVTAFEESTRSSDTRMFDYTHTASAIEPAALTVDGELAKEWTRDGLGRLVEATDHNLVLPSDDPRGMSDASMPLTTQLHYDSLGRLIADRTVTPGQSLGAATIEWQADFLGPHRFVTPSGEELTYEYADSGNLSQLARQAANGARPVIVDFSHQGGLWVRGSVRLGNGAVLAQLKGRDGFGWVRYSGLELVDPVSGTGTAVRREDVLYGPEGRITASRREGLLSGIAAKGYTYDALGRLASHSFEGESPPTLEEFLDAAVDALEDEKHGPSLLANPDINAEIKFNVVDGLEGVETDEWERSFSAQHNFQRAGHPQEQVNGQGIRFDDHHRLATDGTLAYVHDALDRLRTVVSRDGVELVVLYDGLGRRKIERRLAANGGTEYVVLHYQGANVVEETRFGTLDAVNTTTHAPGIDTPLLYAAGPTDANSPNLYVLGTDVRGDVVAAVRYSDGRLVEEAVLGPWGERAFVRADGESCVEGTEGTGGTSLPRSQCAGFVTVLDRFGIGGARAHPRTKLVDLRNRVYATHLKGFLTRDPMGSVDSHGLWTYVAGDPINFRDPLGRTPKEPTAGVEGQAGEPSLGSAVGNLLKNLFGPKGATLDDAEAVAGAAWREIKSAAGAAYDFAADVAGSVFDAASSLYDSVIESVSDPISGWLNDRRRAFNRNRGGEEDASFLSEQDVDVLTDETVRGTIETYATVAPLPKVPKIPGLGGGKNTPKPLFRLNLARSANEGGKLLALGRNRIDGKPALKRFAERVGAKRVLDLTTPKNMNLQQEVLHRMKQADRIHFNLEGMGSDLSRVLQGGRAHTPGSPGFRYTDWEFAQVIDSPALLEKAVFHFPGGNTVEGGAILQFLK